MSIALDDALVDLEVVHELKVYAKKRVVGCVA